MPTWDPNWTDVSFDHAAARDAIDACRSAARQLRITHDERAGMVPDTVEEWIGRYRRDFDVATIAQQNDISSIADALDAQAAAIEAAADRAVVLQSGREAERDEWREERQREQEPEA